MSNTNSTFFQTPSLPSFWCSETSGSCSTTFIVQQQKLTPSNLIYVAVCIMIYKLQNYIHIPFAKLTGFTMEIRIPVCANFMPICTQNRFCFLQSDWLDVIPLSYHLINQFQDPHRQIYVNNFYLSIETECGIIKESYYNVIDSIVVSYNIW